MFHRLPRQALRLQRCQNGRIDYGYIQGKNVSGVSFGEKKKRRRRNKGVLLREVMTLQRYMILNNKGMLYFIHSCLIQKQGSN